MTLWHRVNDMPRKTKRLLAAALALVLAVTAIWSVRAATGEKDDPRGQARATEMSDMGGMDMQGDGSIRLDPDQIRTFGITFGTVELRTLQEDIRTVGIVNFDETRMAIVTPKFDGYVERLYVDFTGRPVRRGEPLADLYSPELVAAQEELLLAARLEGRLPESAIPGVPAGSSNLLAAARRRLGLWDISEAQINEILRTGRPRRTLTLHAPVSGVVVQKNVLDGQAVRAGEPLYTIADLTEVWVEAELREADAGLVQEGDAALVELAAYPGRPIAGRVEYVYPTLQAQARTLKARIAIPNPQGRLRPGMYATVRLAAPGRTALTVPTSAVLRTGDRQLVFVDLGGGRIMPQEVELGGIAGEYVEVLAGLEPGQRVVTSAHYLLDSESNLAEVMRSMVGSMNMSDMGSMDAMDTEGMEGMERGGESMEGMPMRGSDR
ncbi:MAG TPA: efflux RND transporter periplasmic adaptor subunit [Longimicrobiales bacterium]|nr:efflux RND transporter periplasmic adaptor subunit [Longimicrobiales bacterium]